MYYHHILYIFLLKICYIYSYVKNVSFRLNNDLYLINYSKPKSFLMMTNNNGDNNNYNTNKDADLILRQNILLGFVLALCIKLNFSPVDFRNTYICPYGAGAEKAQEELQNSSPNYKCLSTQEYFRRLISAPLIFPGDERYDPEIIKTKMITITKYGTKQD